VLLLRALLLGGLISFHVVGAAVLFRRLFPRECPWLSFLIPPLVFVIGLNFLEHYLALPWLGALLPFLIGGLLIVMLKTSRDVYRELALPGAIFLATYGFVLAVKSLHPDISNLSEGPADLNRILDFCFGDKLPPTDGWLPPYTHQWYYTFQHYGASVVRRLFFVDIGTAYNFSFSLVCAWVAVAGAGAAYYAGNRRPWIAWMMVFLIEAAFTGSSALVALLSKAEPNVWLGINLNIDWDDPVKNPLSWLLKGDPYHETLKLFPPGAWTWFEEFHPTFTGQFLTLFAVLSTQVVFLEKRTNAGWICLALLPLLTVASATWFVPVVLFLCVGGVVVSVLAGRRPESARFVLLAILVGTALLWPTLSSFTTWIHHQGLGWNHPEWRTPLTMFLVQWWPIYLPWFLLCLIWPRLDLSTRWWHAAVAVLFLGVEFLNIGDWRLDTVEKMWGAVYAVGLVTLIPLVLVQRGWVFRLLSGVICAAALVSIMAWGRNSAGWIDWKNGFLHFDGASYLRNDGRKNRMFQVLQRFHGATMLAGHCEWAYSEAPALVVFSENRCYVGWSFSEEICGHAEEADYRSAQDNDFYAGKLADPRTFLENNGISAVLIWPGDQIPDAALQLLQTQLAPGYWYIDCRGTGAENAGVFVRRPANAVTRDMRSPTATHPR
jgi:hypothetical protein